MWLLPIAGYHIPLFVFPPTGPTDGGSDVDAGVTIRRSKNGNDDNVDVPELQGSGTKQNHTTAGKQVVSPGSSQKCLLHQHRTYIPTPIRNELRHGGSRIGGNS